MAVVRLPVFNEASGASARSLRFQNPVEANRPRFGLTASGSPERRIRSRRDGRPGRTGPFYRMRPPPGRVRPPGIGRFRTLLNPGETLRGPPSRKSPGRSWGEEVVRRQGIEPRTH